MNDVKEFGLWALGGFSTLLTLVGSWVFKSIFEKIKDLDNRQRVHEDNVALRFSDLALNLSINAERDKSNYSKLNFLFEQQNTKLDKIITKIEKYDDSISKFYQKNPNVKNPNL